MSEVITLSLRPAESKDKDAVGRFLAAMDKEGLYQRHFSASDASNIALLQRLDRLDHLNRVALLVVDRGGVVLAHGEYVADNGTAEFALMVSPLFRVQGIGTRLLLALMNTAMDTGQRKMIGIAQAVNTHALRLLMSNGFRAVPGTDRTTVELSMELNVPLDLRPIKNKPNELDGGRP